jgi:hypothetical protein
MIRTLVAALFVWLVCGNVRLSAQCIDSTQIQYGAYCNPYWDPVCACDGYTYRNDCFARNNGLTYWYYGICDAVDFDFNPNPAVDYIYVNAQLRLQGDMYVQLFDRFGKIYYTTVFPNVLIHNFQINVNGFPTGIYFLSIYTTDGYRVKKVVIPELQ